MRFLTCRKFLFALLAFSSFILISGAAWGAQLKFAWDPNGESDLAGYKVYYGTTSGNYGSPINVGNVTTYTLNGLTSGQTYYIAVTAYDTSNNESDYSGEVSGTPYDTETVSTPNVLSGPTGGTTGTSYAYATGGSSSSLGHSVQYQFDWKGDGTVLSSWGSATQSNTWTGADTYYVRSRARCATHTSIVSNWSSFLIVTINSMSPGSLAIIPSNGLSASGNRGGPFTPSSSNYTLQNTGGTSINWSVSKGQNWLNLSAMNGSLAPGASTTVAVSINDNANNLDVGTYSDALVITNATNHNGDTNRPVSLNVKDVTVAHKIVTTPPGLEVEIDGTIYKTPKRISWSSGSSHSISVASPQGGKNGKLYLFSSWSDGGTQTHTISAPSVTTTYTASFSSKYSLTTSINNSEGGTITPLGADWYDKDQVVSLSVSANTGYTFTGWSGSVFGKDNPKSITMTGPKKVRANFKKNTYPFKVSSDPTSAGSVVRSPQKFQYSHGDQVILTATPKEGYVFNGWGGDVSGSQNPMTITVNHPMTVIATFTLSSETPRVAEMSFTDPFEYHRR